MKSFLDIILCLNEEYKIEYKTAAKKIDEEQKMQIMADIEREAYYKGIQTGEQRGEQRGEAKMLAKLLNLKFNSIQPEYLTKIENANTTDLEKWAMNVLTANTIDKVFL